MKLFFSLSFLVWATIVSSQTDACGLTYGTDADVENIILEMYHGDIDDAVSAINAGKNSRGTSVGCPETEITYLPADYSIPAISEVESVWNTEIKPYIESFSIDCPRIGRYENNLALGAYYAHDMGYFDDLPVLAEIGNMMEAQQFTPANYSGLIDDAHLGVFGYIHVGPLNPCYPGGVVGASVDAVCDAIPSFCVTYDNGYFSGEEFLTGDQNPDIDFYDGGIAYDHGWIGVQMIEAAIQQTDPTLKSKFKHAAVMAGNWAIREKPVKNHNYTAKLVWLLAELYAWSGEDEYKNALNYKLDKNILPGVLMDLDDNNEVDGMTPVVTFDELTAIAQRPGRMWDGHNAMPWYNAMNAWAITEAYVAFRDQGDLERANELKPYSVAMLDNLAWEINNHGVIPDALGVRDLTYALLIGIWKVAQYEDEPHPDWESAAWALWNSGYFNTVSTHSVCVGLYLKVLSESPYQPLFERSDFQEIEAFTLPVSFKVYPNPSSGNVTVTFDNKLKNIELRVTDINGTIVKAINTDTNNVQLDLSDCAPGVYFIRVISIEKDSQIKVTRLILT